MTDIVDLARRGWNKPPKVILQWVWRQLKARRAAKVLPSYDFWLNGRTLATALGADDFDDLLGRIEKSCPFPGLRDARNLPGALSAAERDTVIARAQRVLAREVDLLGSGPEELGQPIDWCQDFKTGIRWPMAPSRRLPVNRLKESCDIKVPWDLSRLQWLLPAGQAYVLTGDDAYADFAHDIVEEWFIGNPICKGPNWICPMDVALRAVSMLWLFHACHRADTWKEPGFLEQLVKSLYLHGRFVVANLEWADVNGNHLTADLAGLQLIGISLGGAGGAKKWIDLSWRLLTEEFPRQVPDDGVTFEASVPYHRLIAELFLLPAVARRAAGLPVPQDYWQRLTAMAGFTAAYTGPDGRVPIWGDADDGRALPLGNQDINDHRYLLDLIGAATTPSRAETGEAIWWLGTGGKKPPAAANPVSQAFEVSGVHVMRGGADHVFVDAGPVGMAGRGGHGHNDCLSFEACLMGRRLIVDPGAYVYTADWQARNRFRATAAHNTPEVDGQEINRMPRPEWLWVLTDDAKPEVRHWSTSGDVDLLVAAHSGYRRLKSPVTPVRGVMLEKSTHRLFVADGFEGTGEHAVRTRFTFAPDVRVAAARPGVWRLDPAEGPAFLMVVAGGDWQASEEDGEFSPSYGVKVPTRVIAFSRQGPLLPLALVVMPETGAPPDPVRWLEGVVAGRFPVPGLKR